MAGAKRQMEYMRARRFGTDIEAFVIKQTSNWENPVISTEKIVDELDLSTDEVLDQLLESEIIDSKEVGDTFVFW